MKKALSFLSYHNAVPFIGIALFVGASATFAATTGVISLSTITQSASSSAAVQTPAPDVSYLLSVDLDSYMPTAQVTSVTEDSDNYYVAYALSTIALVGNVWQQTTENENMTISKVALGAYQDLGLYVASQLQARTAQELSYLKRVQTLALAQNSASGTETASAYAGLIGKTLNADSTTIPGYVSVVQNPIPQIASAPALPATAAQPSTQPVISIAAASSPDDTAPTAEVNTNATDTPSEGAAADTTSSMSTQSAVATSTTTTPDTRPVIQINGSNPAYINVGDSYADLGAAITGPQADLNLGIKTFLNGALVSNIVLDTSAAATDTIDYVATDANGLAATSTRTVIVQAQQGSTATTTDATTTDATSTGQN
jgi:hypothetical protein